MNEPAQILVITELFLPTKGGTAVWFNEVYPRLGGKGIHIVTADVAGAAAHDEQHANSVHRVSLRRHAWLKPESLVMYLKLLGKSLKLAFQYSFDQVHAGRVLPEGLVGLIVARLFHKQLVVYAHGEEITTWNTPGKQKALRFVYRHADRVIANSEFTQSLLEELGVSSERIVRIYPGVDIKRFSPGLACEDLKDSLSMGEDGRLVLFVGRLSRRKGVDRLVQSVAELSGRGMNVHLAIIGIGEDERYLRDLTKSVGAFDRVHFLGHVSSEDLPRWYNACDIFAMPNREVDGDTEGFGMVFVEAGACEKPVIAGQAGGTASSVVDHETGLRINGENPDEVTSAIEQILSDNDLRERLGQNGLERARTLFSWDRVAELTRQIR